MMTRPGFFSPSRSHWWRALAGVGLALACAAGSASAAHAFSAGNLDSISFVPVEVQSGEDFTLTTHGSGGATPVTFGGCVGTSDDGAAQTFQYFADDSPFPSETDAFANPGPMPWTREVKAYAQDYNGDCSPAPYDTPTYTASVTVLPAASIDGGVDAQEWVEGTDQATATASPYFFDMSGGLSWSVDDTGACMGTEALPAGLSLDSTFSAPDEVPVVSLSGTPDKGTLGIHTVCLALTDRSAHVGFAVLTVTIAAAPPLADTGVDGSVSAVPGVVSVILIVAGVALVVHLRRRSRESAGTHTS